LAGGKGRSLRQKTSLPRPTPLAHGGALSTLGGWAGPLSGGMISHPWSWRALLLGGQFPTLGRPPLPPWARGFVCRCLTHFLCPIFGRGSHPSPALWQALVRWAVNQAKQRGRGRLRWLPWVLGGPGGRNGIAGDETRRLRLHCGRTANLAVCPSRCKCGGPAAL